MLDVGGFIIFFLNYSFCFRAVSFLSSKNVFSKRSFPWTLNNTWCMSYLIHATKNIKKFSWVLWMGLWVDFVTTIFISKNTLYLGTIIQETMLCLDMKYKKFHAIFLEWKLHLPSKKHCFNPKARQKSFWPFILNWSLLHLIFNYSSDVCDVVRGFNYNIF